MVVSLNSRLESDKEDERGAVPPSHLVCAIRLHPALMLAVSNTVSSVGYTVSSVRHTVSSVR